MAEPRSFLVLLLGASRFPELPVGDNPAFANSALMLQQYFQEESQGPGQYTVDSLFDSELPVADQAAHIRDLLSGHQKATDLIVYYVGHGAFLRTRSRQYFLALRTTRSPDENLTALRPEDLSEIINDHFMDRRVYVILDCCFAGEAVREFQGDGLGKLAEHGIMQRGTALLVASSKDEPAISPIGRPHTMFCESLMHVLTTGIPGGGRYLSLEDVAERLRHVLVDKFRDRAVLPEIHSPRQPQGSVAKEPLFPNAAYAAAAPAVPEEVDRLLHSEWPRVRTLAVDYLEPMLDDEDPDVVTLARHHLEGLATNDDSKMVARVAMAVLERHADGRARGTAPEAPVAGIPLQRGPGEAVEERADQRSTRGPEPPSGALRVSIKPARSIIEPHDSVEWTCKVSNASDAPVHDVTVTDGEGRALHEPFDLPAGATRRLTFRRMYGTRGRRLTVLGRARDDRGQLIAAEAKGRVRVAQPPTPPGKPATLSPDTTVSGAAAYSRTAMPAAGHGSLLSGSRTSPDTTASGAAAFSRTAMPAADRRSLLSGSRTSTSRTLGGGGHAFDSTPDLVRSPFSRQSHPAELGLTAPSTPSRSVTPVRFRAALRQIKATAEIGDSGLNSMIRLTEEGERHFRVCVGDLARPPNWQKTAEVWIRDAAVARNEDVVMLKLTPPSEADILDSIRQLVSRIELATGVPIPLDEFS